MPKESFFVLLGIALSLTALLVWGPLWVQTLLLFVFILIILLMLFRGPPDA